MNLAIVKAFKSIPLEDTKKVSLMNRVDKKFLIPVNQLPQILDAIKDENCILTNNADSIKNRTCLMKKEADLSAK